MTSSRRSTKCLVLGVVLGLLCSAAFADAAGASPVWQFNGTTLTGSEETLGHAFESSLTIPGVTTTCKPFVFGMDISNTAGTGQGSVVEAPLSNCFTNTKACTVKSIEAEKLPWHAHLINVASSHYVVIEGFKLSIIYAGETCALGETVTEVKGTAGGLYDNATETLTFNSSTFKATGTTLKVGGQAIDWNGVFTLAATGAHTGQSLTIS